MMNAKGTLIVLLIVAAIGVAIGFPLGWVLKGENVVESVRIDTVRVVEVQIDTLYLPGKTVHKELPVPTPIPITSGDPAEDDTTYGTTLSRYTHTFKDSLLEATIEADVQGKLHDWRFTYTPFFPEIRKTITETITIDRVERIKSRGYLFIGGELRLPVNKETLTISPIVGFTHASGKSLFYRYNTDPSTLGEHWLGFTIPLRF